MKYENAPPRGNSKCKCEDCKRLNREYMRWYRNGKARGTAKHGTRARYTRHKCRCEPCSAANREYQRIWMQRNRKDCFSYDDTFGGLLP